MNIQNALKELSHALTWFGFQLLLDILYSGADAITLCRLRKEQSE